MSGGPYREPGARPDYPRDPNGDARPLEVAPDPFPDRARCFADPVFQRLNQCLFPWKWDDPRWRLA